MNNLYARTVFFVADAERARRFYTEQPGFSLDWDFNEGVLQVRLFGFELILNEVWDRTRTRAGHGAGRRWPPRFNRRPARTGHLTSRRS